MKNFLITTFFILTLIFQAKADRIYIVNYFDPLAYNYTWAEPELITALINNGHTVVVDTVLITSLPAGITTTCIDPINGYDWICFFGEFDYSPLLNSVKAFIDSGGKVFCQYEVSCCLISSTGAAALASGVTGLPILLSANSSIAGSGGVAIPGWADSLQSNCITIVGNAYRCLDGLPASNQLNATATLNSANPPHTSCDNFGFHFSTSDFLGTAHNGAMLGLGDINLFYDSDEPFAKGGTTPVNMSVVDFFFPNKDSECYLIPPGCISSSSVGVNQINDLNNAIEIFPNPAKSDFTVKLNSAIKNASIEIINSLGQIVYTERVDDQNTTISIKSFSSGIYFVRMMDKNISAVRKLIVE